MTISSRSNRPLGQYASLRPSPILDESFESTLISLQDAVHRARPASNENFDQECLKKICDFLDSFSRTLEIFTTSGRVEGIKKTLPQIESLDRLIQKWEIKDVTKVAGVCFGYDVFVRLNQASLKNLHLGLKEVKKSCTRRYTGLLNLMSQESDPDKRAQLAKAVSQSKKNHEISCRILRGFQWLAIDADPSKSSLWRHFETTECKPYNISSDEVKLAFIDLYNVIDISQTSKEETASDLVAPRSLKSIKFQEYAQVTLIPSTDQAKEEFDRLYEIHQKVKHYKNADPSVCPNAVMSNIERTLKYFGNLMIQQEPDFYGRLKELDPSVFGSVERPHDLPSETKLDSKAKLHDLDKKFHSFEKKSEWHQKVNEFSKTIDWYDSWLQDIEKGH